MAKQEVLVVGLGEVGRALFELLKENAGFTVYGFDIEERKMREIEQKALPHRVDVMHLCIPCDSPEDFANIVMGYVQRFKPSLVIINSTVPPGTTKRVHEQSGCPVVHSPVRGVHEDLEHMKCELKRWTKYVGGVDAESSEAAHKHFQALGLKTRVLKNSTETELSKLFETTYRAWMIAFFQEMHRISGHFEADFDEIVDFLEDTHRVRFDRPVMFPGIIGGHCLIPNLGLLLRSYDSKLLRLILESNDKRKEEIRDKKIFGEVEKVKRRAETLQKELMHVQNRQKC
jgi:UDP-N-acetyl-D-mannosaminuronate dehydrogenase